MSRVAAGLEIRVAAVLGAKVAAAAAVVVVVAAAEVAGLGVRVTAAGVGAKTGSMMSMVTAVVQSRRGW
jgi:hypothetical protein